MLSDNGLYYIERSHKDAYSDRIHVIGPGFLLRLIVHNDDNAVKHVGVESLTHDSFQRKVGKGIPFEAKIILNSGPVDDAQALLIALLENPLISEKRLSSQTDEEPWLSADEAAELPKQRTSIATSATWRHLIEAEFDAQPEIIVTNPSRPHPKKTDLVLVPFKSDVTLEYAPDEKVEVLKELDGGDFKCVAYLEHRYSTVDELGKR